MKICWDNLEDLKYNKKGYWFNSNSRKYYIYNESCKLCKEPFLQRKDMNGLYCDKECNRKDHGRKIKGIESKKKLKYEFVKEQIERDGYKLLSKEYKNANSKLKVKCSKGHEYEVTYAHFYTGKRCPECSHPSKKLKYDFVREKIEKESYKLISREYKNARKEIELICNNGHKYLSTYDRFNSNKRCPFCSNVKQFSNAEKEIVEYIKSFGINIIENDRNQIINPLTGRNLEIDIFIPEYHKAIEFNGKYWHSFDGVKDRDRIKKQECKENGIDLLIIDEKDWIDYKDGCLNKIEEFINV